VEGDSALANEMWGSRIMADQFRPLSGNAVFRPLVRLGTSNG
jgi:hypothetical protein